MNVRQMIDEGGAVVMITTTELLEFGKSLIAEARKLNSTHEEHYFTREEFAKRKGVSLGTLWRWEQAGILKGTRRGTRVFYRDSDLLEK